MTVQNDNSNAPFKPAQATGIGLETDPTVRIAHALEHMAAKMGELTATVARIEEHLKQTSRVRVTPLGLGGIAAKT